MPIVKFAQMQEMILKGKKATKEINNFLKISSDSGKGREIKDLKGVIECNNLQLIYPKNKNPVFENLNFNISPGTVAVITGLNGSGKSTLIKILAGVLDFTKGNYQIDQIAFNQISQAWYRKQLSYSPQEPLFVDGTLGENIVGSNKVASKLLSEILIEVDLINYVNVHEQGINMLLSNRGEELPLGIRKRISHARSLINDGKIVLFDEPTEGLDISGRESILKLITKFKSENKTVIIASNDAEISKKADIEIDLNGKPKPNVIIK